MARKKLGEILIQAGVIDENKLRAALSEQARWGGPLGRILVDMRIISEEAGIPVVLLDPLGGPGLEGRATYADLIRWNIRRIADAMRRDRAEAR